jgi:hypothetical protein
MCGIRLDPDIMEETDELRGDVPRSRYIGHALQEYNAKNTLVRKKLAELEAQIQKNNKEQRQEEEEEQSFISAVETATIASGVAVNQEK